MNETTSTGASETPNPVPSGVTPTASGSETLPKTPALTTEELLKKIADLEHSHSNAREQADRQAKTLDKYVKQEKEREAAEQAAKDAQLSEIDRINKQHAELQSQYDALVHELKQERVQRAVEQHASKLNFKYPEVATKLLDWDELEYEESGKPKNVAKLLEKIANAMPDLVRPQEQAPATPAVPVPSVPPALPPFGNQGGRRSIPSAANPATPGITKLHEVVWSK